MLAFSAARRLVQPSFGAVRALSTSARLAAAGPADEPTSPDHAANLATGSPQTAVSSTAPTGAAVNQATNLPKTCVLTAAPRLQPARLPLLIALALARLAVGRRASSLGRSPTTALGSSRRRSRLSPDR